MEIENSEGVNVNPEDGFSVENEDSQGFKVEIDDKEFEVNTDDSDGFDLDF